MTARRPQHRHAAGEFVPEIFHLLDPLRHVSFAGEDFRQPGGDSIHGAGRELDAVKKTLHRRLLLAAPVAGKDKTTGCD